MPKPHISSATQVIRGRYDAKLSDGVIRSSRRDYITQSPALAWIEAARFAWTCGYDVDPPATPVSAELERLESEGSPVVHEFRRTHVIELDEERKALTAWQAMRPWAAGQSEAERAEAARLEREQAEREKAIDSRAQELLAGDEAKRLEKARAQARKELAS